MMMKLKRGAYACLFASGLMVGCGGGGSSYSSSGSSPVASNGTLYVAITDAPSCGFDAVNVTVNKVRVNQSTTASDTDAGWTDIVLNPAQKINLLNLTNGTLLPLGQTPLTAGHYTQLRLVLDPNTANGMANSVVVSGTTTEVTLDTPSAVQSGIKLAHEFDVATGQRADVVLDFDACKSIVTKGNGKYALKPVVKVVPTILNGINGFMNTALLSNHVMISAQQNGAIVSSTVPNATTGEFFLGRLVPGSYDVVVTADGSTTAVISGVPVANTTSVTLLSSTTTPLNLATVATLPANISGIATLPLATATETVTVAAKQSFASGPSFVVKYVNADTVNATYLLQNLPTVSPQLAQYSSTLPLVFTTPIGALPGIGKYTVLASASNYQTATITPVDISTGSKTGINFNLVP